MTITANLKKITPPKNYRLYIDEIGKSQISGWALNKNNIENPPQIEIRSNNQYITSTKADQFRQDLKDAGIGNGHHAFSLKIDINSIPNTEKLINIYIDSQKVTKKQISLINDTIGKTSYSYHLDSISETEITGWAKCNQDDDHRPTLEIKQDAIILGHTVANIFRQDLKDSNLGDGCYGFKIEPLIGQFPSEEVHCDLYINNVKQTCNPMTLQVTTEQLNRAKYQAKFNHEITNLNDQLNSELTRLQNEIADLTKSNGENEPDMTNIINIILKNIAELNVKASTIEKALIKLSEK